MSDRMTNGIERVERWMGWVFDGLAYAWGALKKRLRLK